MTGAGGAGKQEKLGTALGGTEFSTNFQRTFTGMDKSRTQERRLAYENEQFKGIVHKKMKTKRATVCRSEDIL